LDIGELRVRNMIRHTQKSVDGYLYSFEENSIKNSITSEIIGWVIEPIIVFA
jgi:hypothetical protein